jgi:glyoxylase-like metal-dependent hydrolase (beta-lactamase superfamily II)
MMGRLRLGAFRRARFLALLVCGIIACPALAIAGAPRAGTQAPGFYRMMIGDFEVTALSDGTHPFPIDTVVQGVSKEEIARDLEQAFLQPPVQGSINAFLVNTGSKLVLIDSGAGVLYGECCGKLLANLRASGYAPEQVDEVLLTHLHKDHVGGIVTNGAMTFPNAIVRTSQTEADYWLNPANKANAPAFLSSFFDAASASLAPYIAAGRFKTFSGDTLIAPGIRSMVIPGHTPGHSAYLVQSGTQSLLVWGDIIHVAAIQMQNPHASVEYDSDAGEAQRERIKLLNLVADRHYLVGAAHIAFPGIGHVRQNGTTFSWIPVNYDATPVR